MISIRTLIGGAALVTAACVFGAFGTTNARASLVCNGMSGGFYLELGIYNSCNSRTWLEGSSPEELLVDTTAASGYAVTGSYINATGSGKGIQGITASNGANTYGVYGWLNNTTPGLLSAAVYGHSDSTTANGYGVMGSTAGNGFGVFGYTGTNGTAVRGAGGINGGWFSSPQNDGTGAVGVVSGTGGDGVRGEATVNGGVGVRGLGFWGIFGNSLSNSGTGVLGLGGNGVVGNASVSNGTGVLGTVSADGHGVRGEAGAGGIGVIGKNAATSGLSYGVEGVTSSNADLASGVLGQNNGSSALSTGVYGSAASGIGLLGIGGTAGVLGYNPNAGGLAGYFLGDVAVTGTLTKGAGAFRIDHPLDPAHKYLQHSFVESPDMKDVYDGVVTTDAKGFATVKLPRWFQALNRSFRYQLTIVGTRGWRARIVREIQDNRFTLQSDEPNVKVSWQVTGIRHDAYANAHRIPVELAKPAADQGKYLHPELYGKPGSASVMPNLARKAAAQGGR